MELTLRFEKNQLLIDYVDDVIGFVVLTEDGKQLDFGIDKSEWQGLKRFIDERIDTHKTDKPWLP